MKTEYDIERILTESRPSLDASSRTHLWSQIEARLATARPIRSPFLFSFVETRTLVPVVVILAILVSTGGVAVASETARPGDLLFPVERALENARLKMTFSTESREALVQGYSAERLEEIREIIEEEARLKRVNDNSPLFTASTTLRSLTIEADVFTDTTVVEVELNDEKTLFHSEANTRDEVAEAVLERFPNLTKGQVESSLDFVNENRASRAKDRGQIEFSSEGSIRVGSAVTEALTFIEESEDDDDDTTDFLKELQAEIDGLNIKMDNDRIKARDRAKSRFEWKTDDVVGKDERAETQDTHGARVRIEEKDGEIKINITEGDDTNNPEILGEKTILDSDTRKEGRGENSGKGNTHD